MATINFAALAQRAKASLSSIVKGVQSVASSPLVAAAASFIPGGSAILAGVNKVSEIAAKASPILNKLPATASAPNSAVPVLKTSKASKVTTGAMSNKALLQLKARSAYVSPSSDFKNAVPQSKIRQTMAASYNADTLKMKGA